MQSAQCGKTVKKIPGAHFLYPWKGLINVMTLVKSNICQPKNVQMPDMQSQLCPVIVLLV